MSNQLENKRALVTGGSRGIGAAIVMRLASDLGQSEHRRGIHRVTGAVRQLKRG